MDTLAVPKIYSENPTVEQLQASINNLSEAFSTLRMALYIGFMVILVNVLRAIYSFAKASTPADDTKTVGSKIKKPILGLNDETV